MRKGELDLRRVTAHLRAAFLLGASRFNPLFAEIDPGRQPGRAAHSIRRRLPGRRRLRAPQGTGTVHPDAAFLNGDNWCLYTLRKA